MTAKITPTIELNAVKHLAHGRSLEFVAEAMRLTDRQVTTIADTYGYPDLQKLAWAVDELKGNVDRADRPQPRAPKAAEPANTGTAPQPAPSPTKDAPVWVVDARPPTVNFDGAGEVDAILRAGTQSQRKSTRARATRLLEQLDKLADQLRAEHAAAEERRRREAAREEARREVAALEEKLRKARARLHERTSTRRRPSGAPVGSDAASAATVRAWAAEQQVPCPASGRVPKRVRQAYEDAHTGDVAGAA